MKPLGHFLQVWSLHISQENGDIDLMRIYDRISIYFSMTVTHFANTVSMICKLEFRPNQIRKVLLEINEGGQNLQSFLKGVFQ